ncbi:MAG: DUF309 domain-containing protein [Leptospira sp.]|nr:DUF309 domain-containing protein [Leptospira sp.]
MKFDPEVFLVLETITGSKDPESTRDYAFLKAIEFYRRGKFFEAHEVFEFQWKKESGPMRVYIQALIQISVMMNKIYVIPNSFGARSLGGKALCKLNDLLDSDSLRDSGKGILYRIRAELESVLNLTEILEYKNKIPIEIGNDWNIFL